ncbi:RIKEN cDNA 1700011F14, isoform CRA_b, partial [Mus musculus]
GDEGTSPAPDHRILRLPYQILRASRPEMSLESLFQHIIFSEHQAEESRRVMREVRSEITRCRGKIKKATEDLSEEKIKLESKVQQLSEKSFLLELLKTHENALERQLSEIISERDTLLQACEAIKNKTTEEEERFIKEITDFNDNYEITKKRDTLMKENIEMEMADLDSQADVLRREMKSVERNRGQLWELQKLKNELLQELFTLQKKLKVLKDEETEAICITKQLEAEKTKVRDKPQHDPECVRLKRELDLYKAEDMESVYRALQAEVDLLELALAPKDPQDSNSLSHEPPHT